MHVQPYLSFEGRAEEALDFYAKAVGAQVNMKMRFNEAPRDATATDDGCAGMGPPPAAGDKIMHSEFKIGESVIMASDGFCSGKTSFGGISLAIQARDDAEARRIFDGLSAGGQVQQPLIKTFFATSFGVLADKFGVSWMVVAPATR
jgi:PhnB protein